MILIVLLKGMLEYLTFLLFLLRTHMFICASVYTFVCTFICGELSNILI